MEVSVRELKAWFSEYLRRVQHGEEVVIARHGRPVGRLVPPVDVADEEVEAMFVRELRSLPWIRPASGGKPLGAQNPLPHRPGERMLSDLVRENRG